MDILIRFKMEALLGLRTSVSGSDLQRSRMSLKDELERLLYERGGGVGLLTLFTLLGNFSQEDEKMAMEIEQRGNEPD